MSLLPCSLKTEQVLSALSDLRDECTLVAYSSPFFPQAFQADHQVPNAMMVSRRPGHPFWLFCIALMEHRWGHVTSDPTFNLTKIRESAQSRYNQLVFRLTGPRLLAEAVTLYGQFADVFEGAEPMKSLLGRMKKAGSPMPDLEGMGLDRRRVAVLGPRDFHPVL